MCIGAVGRTGTRRRRITGVLTPGYRFSVTFNFDLERSAQGIRRPQPDGRLAGEFEVTAEGFERIVEGKLETPRCRRRLVVHCHMCVRSRIPGQKEKQGSVIRSPSTGEEELPLMTPQ